MLDVLWVRLRLSMRNGLIFWKRETHTIIPEPDTDRE